MVDMRIFPEVKRFRKYFAASSRRPSRVDIEDAPSNVNPFGQLASTPHVRPVQWSRDLAARAVLEALLMSNMCSGYLCMML
jgi:hypothetical protein